MSTPGKRRTRNWLVGKDSESESLAVSKDSGILAIGAVAIEIS